MSQPERLPFPNRLSLRKTEVDLLTYCAGDMIPEIKTDPGVKELRQLAFQHWDTEREEEVQVHVIVTRDETEFLEPFVTAETR